MLGNVYAQKGDWPNAAAKWWKASGTITGPAQMEYYNADSFNIDAMWMLYYYRSHLPRA